jgi:hypothetical protein
VVAGLLAVSCKLPTF